MDEAAEGPKRGRRILIIDDDADVRGAIAKFLTRAGYDIELAEDGVAGLQRLEQDPPSLVLLDMMMPNMNGLEFLKAEKRAKVAVPVILVTAVEDEALARQAMKLGAADYLTKPVDFGYLSTSIRAILALSVPSGS